MNSLGKLLMGLEGIYSAFISARVHFCRQTATTTKRSTGYDLKYPSKDFFSLKLFIIHFPGCRKIYSLLPEEGVNKSNALDIVLGLCGMPERQEQSIFDNFV